MKQTLTTRLTSPAGITALAVVMALLTAGVWFATSSCDGAGTTGQPKAAASGTLPAGARSGASPAATPPPAATATGKATWWRPAAGLSWQWQLTGALDTSVRAEVYEVDGERTSAAQVAALHKAGRKVVCYVNAGAYEAFRADKGSFPKAVLGKTVTDWENERWLDIRRWDILEPIMTARIAGCRQKGFDAVEADNVDGYRNDTGFPLTAADQLGYNRRIADLAHRNRLAVALKNNLEQAADLVGVFDFAVVEDCVKYRECGLATTFVKAGKPVFHVEYELPPASFCPTSRMLGLSSIRKRIGLDAWRETC